MGGQGIDQIPPRYPLSGIDVVIVGGGPSGLLAALECWRKGHNVRIFESRATPDMSGDIIVIAPSAFSTLRHWPWMRKRAQEVQYATSMNLRRTNGELIAGPFPLPFETARGTAMLDGDHPPRLQWRPKLYGMLMEQLARIGLDIEFDKRAVDYYEMASKGGVRFKDGTHAEGDLIIAADGVHSKSWKVTKPEGDTSVNSGYSIYRTAFDSAAVLADPVVSQFLSDQHLTLPVLEFWYADDMHAHLAITEDMVSWGVTHPSGTGITDGSHETATESWTSSVPIEQALRTISAGADNKAWHPAFERIVRHTPPGGLVDFKLKFRSPNPAWHSGRHARVLQIGDAAHTFIPTSGSGGTMAMEDAISIATCLQVAGKSNVPWAVRVHTKLRYDRVSCVQKMGFVNRDAMHHADWDEVARDPRRSKIRMGDWNWSHLPEAYALDNYARCLDHLMVGSPFANTNVPAGFKDGDQVWTVESITEESKIGGVKVDGSWLREEIIEGLVA